MCCLCYILLEIRCQTGLISLLSPARTWYVGNISYNQWQRTGTVLVAELQCSVLMCAKVSMLCRHSSGTVCVLSALVSRWGLVARCCPGDEIKGVPRGGRAARWLTAVELIYVSDACTLHLDAVYRFVIHTRLSPPNSPCSYNVNACLA